MINYNELFEKSKELAKEDYRQILNGLTNDERINNYWSTYKKKTKYAQNIEFKEIVRVLDEFLDNI